VVADYPQVRRVVHTMSMSAGFDELRSIGLFGGLTDQQLSELLAGSCEVDFGGPWLPCLG